MREPIDLLIVGGGINGAGIARDAAGRGFEVLLCERGDLAGATSSASSKLIHGGLRYLEHYEFRLVRKALSEREVLLRTAPHIVWPLRFVLPHDASLRPAWMVRAGLFLYDHLGGRERLPGSASLDLRRDTAGAPLKPSLRKGFCYSDCWVQDSRLVVLNAMDARERGATILTHTTCKAARRVDGLWEADLEADGGASQTVRARALVNAAGPWVDQVLEHVVGPTRKSGVRLVKGSHFVVPRLYEGPQAYILQNDDRRVVFVLPYEERFSLIGTTDIPFEGDPADARISAEETAYLCAAVGRFFARPPRPEDAVWSYSGVRPLYDDAELDASAVTRDYVFDIDARPGEAALLSVFGGKITTYRRLAEHAMEKLGSLLNHQGLNHRGTAWTKTAALPGGDMPDADFERYLGQLNAAKAWLPADLSRRYARAYGTRVERLIGPAKKLPDLGQHLGEGLYEAEVDYLLREEWARNAEDILWRRSKLGLHLSRSVQDRLADWLSGRREAARPEPRRAEAP